MAGKAGERTAARALRAALAAGVAGIAAVTAFEVPAMAATGPSISTPVAYARSGVIYITKGTGEKRLTEDSVNWRPRFSPDHKRLAYLHNGTVWVMNTDGTAKRQVSDRVGGGPAWSPDGRWIAFAGRSCTGGPGVYRVSSTVPGSTPEVLFPASCKDQPLPEMAAPMGSASEPELADRLRNDDAVAWSPDGGRIAFRGGECENIADACLSIGNVASGGEQAIDVYGGGGNLNDGFAVVPAWRGDGKRISWTAYTRDALPVHLEEADPNGSNRRQVGRGEDREMVYLGSGKGLLTGTHNDRSWVILVDLTSGKRTPLRPGSQPAV